jgi:hypothetical protein
VIAESIGAPLPTGQTYYEPGAQIMDSGLAGMGGADGNYCCLFGGPGCGLLGNCSLSGVYVRTEYLVWSARGMNLPPLVTTSPQGTDRDDAGVLGEAGTSILFGGERTDGDERSGGRITIGRWFDPCQRLGVEADYFALADDSTSFQQFSTGDPILARPFFDVTIGSESSSLVAFPNVIQGTIAAEHETSFQGAGVRGVYNLACGDGTGISCLTNCPVPTGYRFDALVGYRFVRLDDRLRLTEDSTSLETGNPGSFFIRDQFVTENDFHGVDFGTALHFCKGCWSLDLLSKIALGNVHSTVSIDGSTVITQGGVAQQFSGGFLAQRTNSGVFTSDDLAVVPELGVTVGYRINPCWRLTLGYTFLYWSQVARAGDQIDRAINPNLFPPEDPPVTGLTRPEFRLLYSDYWVQGVNIGLEGKW